MESLSTAMPMTYDMAMALLTSGQQGLPRANMTSYCELSDRSCTDARAYYL